MEAAHAQYHPVFGGTTDMAEIGRLALSGPDHTDRLAQSLAPHVGAGDSLLLAGDLGTGKTHFARALIRAKLPPESASQDIPSPSFTLIQGYSGRDGEIWHADLYRLQDPDEVLELGLDEALDSALCLIEWPDRLGPDRPDRAIGLHFLLTNGDPNRRDLVLHAAPGSALAERLLDVMHATRA